MKAKTLGVMATAVVVLAGLAFVIFRPGDRSVRETPMGQRLFEDLMVGDIARIRITGHDGRVAFRNTEDGWVVVNRNGFPAEFSRIAELVKKVQDLKIGRSFQASKEIQTRLALLIPETSDVPSTQKGTRVRFETEQGTAQVDLVVGTARQSDSGSGGQYVMPADGATIYLVDKTFKFLQTTPVEWLNRELLNIETDQVLRVECFSNASGKSLYTLIRSAPGKDFELKPVPASGAVAPAELKRVAEALTPLRIEDVQAKEKPISGRHRFEYTLSDRRRYTVTIGKKEDVGDENALYPVQVGVDVIEGENGSPEEPPPESATQVERQRRLFEKWIFLVSEWEIDNFISDPLKLISPDEKG